MDWIIKIEFFTHTYQHILSIVYEDPS